MHIDGFNLWLRVILVRVWPGRSLCTSLPNDVKLSLSVGLPLACFHVLKCDGLGEGFCWWLWLLWVLGCPSLTPFLAFELFSSPLLSEEIESQSWPGNRICNLWRIRSLKLISQRTQESQSCRSLHVFGKSGLLTVPYLWARKQRLQGTVCKTILCFNLGVGQGPKFQWVRSW